MNKRLTTLSGLPGPAALVAAILLSLYLGAPRAGAQSSGDSGHDVIKVVAHLPLNGMHVNQMFIQQRDRKDYLYLHRPTKDAFALVDVTHPDKPVLLSRDALKETSATQLQTPASGSALAISVTSDQSSPAAQGNVKLPTETVSLVDMSDPKNPKTAKTFKGVTSVYPDDSRKLVYIVNADGLWIVSHHMTHPMPLCTSEDALTPYPDCQ
jgi:hypothetical protein